jgi:hypothetical protein
MSTEENNNQKWLQARDAITSAVGVINNEHARVSASSMSLIGAIEDAILDIDFDPTSEDGLSTNTTYVTTSGRGFRGRKGSLQKVRDLQVTLFGGVDAEGVTIDGLFEELREVPLTRLED